MSTHKIRLLPQVAIAHMVSHVHMMALPALLPILPAFLNVGYIELGLAISIFNIISALVQAPLGFAVDRYGARQVLLAGLTLGSFSYLLIAIIPTYTCLLLAMGLAGIANGVYHPADYSLLSRGIDPKRMGKAFSIHTFAGFLGTAITPAILLGLAAYTNPGLAFAGAAIIGFAVLAFLLIPGSGITQIAAPRKVQKSDSTTSNSGLSVFTPMIGVLTLLFVLLSLSTSSIERFSVSAFIQGYDISLSWANIALTAFLFSGAIGVLSGGALADHTKKHGLVAAGAFAIAAILTAIVATGVFSNLPLTIVMGMIGFLTGVITPSRDMLVRAAAPVGSEGKTFGIVSTGFNIGGALGPVLFGWLLDSGHPQSIFLAAVTFMSLTVILTVIQERYLAKTRQTKSTER